MARNATSATASANQSARAQIAFGKITLPRPPNHTGEVQDHAHHRRRGPIRRERQYSAEDGRASPSSMCGDAQKDPDEARHGDNPSTAAVRQRRAERQQARSGGSAPGWFHCRRGAKAHELQHHGQIDGGPGVRSPPRPRPSSICGAPSQENFTTGLCCAT